MKAEINHGRRNFLVSGLTASGALLFGVPLPRAVANGSGQIGFFVTINPDNSIVIGSNQPEIGQGIKTTLPMLITEELEADWSQVSVRQMPLGIVKTDQGFTWKYGGQGVGGSTGLTSNWTYMREVGASARLVLQQAAGQQWGVPAEDCRCR